ncbi:hypothetical protein SCHPADRAFT_911160 [Schizopora paradoxa]|uniref:Uncharacterized protein n=1 Tax=Schizopora paradoxa TaxID=27342 RepID=A0A0H2RK98_9AGAM|nr:hypothetical protein SCHPADRAFT_911160 [Schizopora paradoxa]
MCDVHDDERQEEEARRCPRGEQASFLPTPIIVCPNLFIALISVIAPNRRSSMKPSIDKRSPTVGALRSRDIRRHLVKQRRRAA